jgi:aspartate kinase
MIVLKFGGTSMGDDKTWQEVLKIIQKYEQPVVIVSATARTTRQLMAAADSAQKNLAQARDIASDIQDRHQSIIRNFMKNYPDADPSLEKKSISWIDECIDQLHSYLDEIHACDELNAELKDRVASIGEQLSSFLLVQCGRAASMSTKWTDARKVMRTDSNFGQASPDTNVIKKQAEHLKEQVIDEHIPVMGGYYGEDTEGRITTLGFEGSDYSASLVGAALNAERIEIWTDVSGIYTCDPRVVDEARPIPQLSFQEATELAYFGAKVLHPKTTKPASQSRIPMLVKNIFAPEDAGTSIDHRTVSNGRIKAMTYKEDCAVITVTSSQTVMGYEFLSGVFDILRWHHLPVDVVTTTEASVSIAIADGAAVNPAMEQLKSFGTVNVENEQGIISLIGCNVESEKLLINDVLEQMNDGAINLISFSRSKGNLNLVMNSEYIVPSVKAIHRQLFG